MFDSLLLLEIHKFRKILIILINDSILVVVAFTKKEGRKKQRQ